MTSESDYEGAALSRESSSDRALQPSRPSSRLSSRQQSHTPLTPRKRRRLESVDAFRIRKYYLQGKYNDDYRILFNDDVSCAAVRFHVDESTKYYTKQVGASIWTAEEQRIFFAALARLGKDQVAVIAAAVRTKSIPETQQFLLLLHDAAIQQGDARLTYRDIPAAIDVGNELGEQLDTAGEALAWFQEQYEANQEQEKYGDHWLLTTELSENIERESNPEQRNSSASPFPSGTETPRRGGKMLAGCV
jgi:RNA polymerase I-specific transcription initiation factor RRN5